MPRRRDRRARRAAAREARRERRAAERRRQGSAWPGILAAILLPVLVLEARFPLWLAITLAAGLFFGLQALLASRPARNSAPALEPARQETADILLAEGSAALVKLERAGGALRDREMRASVVDLTETAEQILADVRADPAKAMSVRRLMTFYLPNAASVVEGWRALEGRALPSPERHAQTRETLTELNEVFDRYANAMVQPQAQTLDLDLKVLKDALRTDLERLP